jgi:hypothetical protein
MPRLPHYLPVWMNALPLLWNIPGMGPPGHATFRWNLNVGRVW